MNHLAGKSILISGASSGIGAATAIACAKQGMKVGLMARRKGKLDLIAHRIGDAHCKVIVGSVDSDQDCSDAIEQTQEAFGELYAVLANAGYGQEKPCSESSFDEIRAMFETNFYGSLRLVQPALDGFRERKSGHAIMVSSCLSKIGLPRYGAYCASKAAQDHFCRAMRLELDGTGVHVSSVHPIGTKTEFFDEAARKSGGSLQLAGSSTRFMQSPDRVARSIVRCLQKPKGEVWTSFPVRFALGASVMMPGMTDWALKRAMNKRTTEGGA